MTEGWVAFAFDMLDHDIRMTAGLARKEIRDQARAARVDVRRAFRTIHELLDEGVSTP